MTIPVLLEWSRASGHDIVRPMTTLTSLPESFAAGTTVAYTRTLTDYPANGGWTLSLVLNGIDRLAKNAAANGADHAMTLLAAETSPLRAGLYTFEERVTKSPEVYTVSSGQVTVTANLTTAAVGELQSWEEKTLAVVEAALEGRLASDLESYQIAGRAVTKIPAKELMAIRNELSARVARMKNGGQIGRRHLARFCR
jgi:hypothetical protein